MLTCFPSVADSVFQKMKISGFHFGSEYFQTEKENITKGSAYKQGHRRLCCPGCYVP